MYPTPQKTWEFKHISVPGTGTKQGDIGEILYQWKQALTTLPSHPWTVAGSSNGTTGAMDNVDRVTSGAVPTFIGSVGWWMVIEADSSWGGGQMLIYSDNGGSFACNVTIKWSLGGLYTGGGATTLPTATDEDGTVNQDLIDWTGFANGGNTAFHVCHSTDGKITRTFFAFQNLIKSWVVAETAGAPRSQWADPRFYGRGPRGNLNQLTPDIAFNPGQEFWRMKVPSSGAFSYLNSSRAIAGPQNAGILLHNLLAIPNEISGASPFYTVGLLGHTTAGIRGGVGYLFDWWYTTPNVNAGDGFPSNGDKDFISFGNGCIHPWDGTTPDLG